jgi:hypothetical protein
MSIKEIHNAKTGKTQFRAYVYHDGQYFKSRTFPTRALAEAYERTNLKDAIEGKLPTPRGKRYLMALWRGARAAGTIA